MSSLKRRDAEADVAVVGHQEFRAAADQEIDLPARRDVVDPIFVRDVVETLELSQRAVLVVEQHAGVRTGRAAQILHGVAGEGAAAVVESDVKGIHRDGVQADEAAVLEQRGVAQIAAVDEHPEITRRAGRGIQGGLDRRRRL